MVHISDNIHDELCTYEVAKLAKEKGFPQDVFGTCEMKSSCYLEDGRFHKDGCIYPIEDAYTAPTQSLLQRWLREEKGIEVNTFWDNADNIWLAYAQEMDAPELERFFPLNKPFSTYELALEAAELYALKNLL